MILCLSKLFGEVVGVKPKTAPLLDVRRLDQITEMGHEIRPIPPKMVLWVP
jgi:hypothetical protein